MSKSDDLISREWVIHNVLSLVDPETRIYAKQRLDNAPIVEPYKGEECLNIKMTEEELAKFKEDLQKANRQLYTVTSNTFVEGASTRPQGEWVYKEFDEETGIRNSYFCSKCGCPQSQFYINFCGNCGADMQKGGAE